MLPWWDDTSRLTITTNTSQPLREKLGLSRVQLAHCLTPLGGEVTIDSLTQLLYEARTPQNMFGSGTDRQALRDSLRSSILDLRMDFCQVDLRGFDLPSIMGPLLTDGARRTIASKNRNGQVQADATARKAKSTELMANPDLYSHIAEDSKIHWIQATILDAGKMARRTVLEQSMQKPLLLDNIEMLQVAKHMLRNGLCAEVLTLKEFVEGMAQRFSGLSLGHLGVLEPLWMQYVRVRSLTNALEDAHRSFELASVGAVGRPGLLFEGVRDLGLHTRVRFDQMVQHIEEDPIDEDGESSPVNNRLLEQFIIQMVSPPTNETNDSPPASPTQLTSPALRRLMFGRTFRAMGISDSPASTNSAVSGATASPNNFNFGDIDEEYRGEHKGEQKQNTATTAHAQLST